MRQGWHALGPARPGQLLMGRCAEQALVLRVISVQVLQLGWRLLCMHASRSAGARLHRQLLCMPVLQLRGHILGRHAS